MKKTVLKFAFRLCSVGFAVAVAFVLFSNLYVLRFAKPFIYSNVEEIPQRYAVIVPGARVYRNTVSHVVRDRAEAAARCVKAGKARKVLVSGDHGRRDYDEANRIRIFMEENYAVPDELIFTDHAGFSTYETMYRAKSIFKVDGAIVCTQRFHAARSVFLARKLGLDAVALEAPEIQPYTRRVKLSWEIRESLARTKAVLSVLFKPKPKFLGEQIPITGDAEKSRG